MMCSSHGPMPWVGPDVAVGGQHVRGHREDDDQDDADDEGRQRRDRRAGQRDAAVEPAAAPDGGDRPGRPADEDRQDDGQDGDRQVDGQPLRDATATPGSG